MRTQAERIREYMEITGSITQRDAFQMGIYRLGARIFDLKKAGYPIKTEMKKAINKDGSESTIARYTPGW